MALIPDNDAPGDIGEPKVWRTSFFEDSRKGRPWENRLRFVEPQRTWSGKVVYFKKRKPFTEADLVRITNRISEAQPPNVNNWVFELLQKYWKIFYDFYRPLFETLGIGKIYDFVATYTFSRAWDMIEGNVIDPIQDALDLIGAANEGLPVEERLALVTEQDYTAEVQGYQERISQLEAEIEDLKRIIAGLEEASYGRKG